MSMIPPSDDFARERGVILRTARGAFQALNINASTVARRDRNDKTRHQPDDERRRGESARRRLIDVEQRQTACNIALACIQLKMSHVRRALVRAVQFNKRITHLDCVTAVGHTILVEGVQHVWDARNGLGR